MLGPPTNTFSNSSSCAPILTSRASEPKMNFTREACNTMNRPFVALSRQEPLCLREKTIIQQISSIPVRNSNARSPLIAVAAFVPGRQGSHQEFRRCLQQRSYQTRQTPLLFLHGKAHPTKCGQPLCGHHRARGLPSRCNVILSSSPDRLQIRCHRQAFQGRIRAVIQCTSCNTDFDALSHPAEQQGYCTKASELQLV